MGAIEYLKQTIGHFVKAVESATGSDSDRDDTWAKELNDKFGIMKQAKQQKDKLQITVGSNQTGDRRWKLDTHQAQRLKTSMDRLKEWNVQNVSLDLAFWTYWEHRLMLRG